MPTIEIFILLNLSSGETSWKISVSKHFLLLNLIFLVVLVVYTRTELIDKQ